jgi:hypothetical protein
VNGLGLTLCRNVIIYFFLGGLQNFKNIFKLSNFFGFCEGLGVNALQGFYIYQQ